VTQIKHRPVQLVRRTQLPKGFAEFFSQAAADFGDSKIGDIIVEQIGFAEQSNGRGLRLIVGYEQNFRAERAEQTFYGRLIQILFADGFGMGFDQLINFLEIRSFRRRVRAGNQRINGDKQKNGSQGINPKSCHDGLKLREHPWKVKRGGNPDG
ncbi:MAG TPA: hypothetical protein VIV82_08275, partial [Verrucomicrobiae bacterium]